jgi:hypothetical protein
MVRRRDVVHVDITTPKGSLFPILTRTPLDAMSSYVFPSRHVDCTSFCKHSVHLTARVQEIGWVRSRRPCPEALLRGDRQS